MHMLATATRARRDTGGAAASRGHTWLGPALALIHGGQVPTRAALGAKLGITRATAGAGAAGLQALRLVQVDTTPATGGGAPPRAPPRPAPAPPPPGAGGRPRGPPGRTGSPSTRTVRWRSPPRS